MFNFFIHFLLDYQKESNTYKSFY